MHSLVYICCVILLPYISAELILDDDLNLKIQKHDPADLDPSSNGTAPAHGVTPSPTCQTIVEDVGWAISNYTLCSVKNARPIHLCEKCVNEYIQVRTAHEIFEATIDTEGNICGDYFVNLDRLQIVSEAYKYVRHLWGKANCNSCFKLDKNGTITKFPTDQTLVFDKYYKETEKCFRNHSDEFANQTCTECLEAYNNLTESYINIQDTCGDAVCMDIVDTMNITRFIWSDRGCVKRQGAPISLKICVGLMALLPITFYLLAYFLANKQEAPILQQKRLAEVFAVNSNSFNFIPTQGGNSEEGPRIHGFNLGIFRRHPPPTQNLSNIPES